jgi:hypothetical protein
MLDGKGTTTEMNASVLPNESFWWNTTTSHIYKKVAGSWSDLGAPTTGLRVIYKDGTGSDDKIYQYGTSAWDSGTMPSENWAITIEDNGDDKNAQYIYDADTTDWVKIADVDWGNAASIGVTPSGNLASTNVQDALYELQGDIDDLDLDVAYNHGSTIIVDDTVVDWQLTDTKSFKITSDTGTTNVLLVKAMSAADEVTINAKFDVNGGAVTIDGSSVAIASTGALTLKDQYLTNAIDLSETGTTGLAAYFSGHASSIIGAINYIATTGGTPDTLDEAYDGPTGSGSGRTITVDSGSVKLDATSGTYAPLELTQQAAAPSSGLAAGQLTVVGGQLYVYDGTRTKWLSVTNIQYQFADNSCKGKYMPIGTVNNANTGYKMLFNGTLVGVTVQGTSATGKQLQIRQAGTAIKSFTLTLGKYTSSNDDVNFNAGDYLQVFSPADNDLTDVVVSVFIRWRIA